MVRERVDATPGITAEQLFVFAGAGVSRSLPAGLPLFDWLRNEILDQLGLDAFAARSAKAGSARVAVASGLAPEPFMLVLTLAGIDVQSWLKQVLGGEQPNAAHRALADLAARGACVWTVNFDELTKRRATTLYPSPGPTTQRHAKRCSSLTARLAAG